MPVPGFGLAFLYPDAAVIERPRWQQPDSRTRNALIRSLRGLGERGFALLTQRWTTLRNVTASPSRIAGIAKAALVLVQFEHKMIELRSLRNPQRAQFLALRSGMWNGRDWFVRKCRKSRELRSCLVGNGVD